MRQSWNDSESLFKATAPRLVRVYKVHRHLIRVVLFSLVSVSAFNFDNPPSFPYHVWRALEFRDLIITG